MPRPEGYAKDSANRWICAPGYAGSVYFFCDFDQNCTLINEPRGAAPMILYHVIYVICIYISYVI